MSEEVVTLFNQEVTTLFNPISEGYADGEGGYSCAGYMLRGLKVSDSILLQMTSDVPFYELDRYFDLRFFAPGVISDRNWVDAREGADALTRRMELYNDSGAHAAAMVLMGYILKAYEPWLGRLTNETDYLNFRIKVLNYIDTLDGSKIFPRPLSVVRTAVK